MSQHDLDIANQGFPATRADINNALQALGSSNSGATAPSTTYANQLWYDTANNIIKIRNEDNDAWISLFTLDQTNDNIEALTIDGSLTVDGGTIKLDGDYPTGSNNVALGNTALDDGSLSGANNTAIGSAAMTAHTSGNNNTAVGHEALTASTTGFSNVAVGGRTLDANTTGAQNAALGYQALSANTTANNNTAVGYQALTANTTGTNNACFGRDAGERVTTGSQNTLIGDNAGENITTTNNNTFIGRSAGSLITTGANNTIIGRFNGNQNNCDIRTSDKFVVLSDGDGVPRGIFDGSGQFMVNFGLGTDIDGAIGHSSGNTTFGVQKTDGIRIATPGSSYWNRFGDGVIIYFRSAGTNEGQISVSGTTVSYSGGHLSRWSQLADNTKDTSIVKGTVMTNLDQMAEWTKDGVTEDNEQLNCMAVSSVEGDPNVAGVFVNWDEDDEDYDNDMNVAMTGDMVIRIAQGTTVARGDLLMSAGDGTAKPQGDDIVRSKTIAKVTSTNVSHTYDDGSYLVPCVVMAC